MTFDASGRYFLPSGYFVKGGELVLPSQHNPALEDIERALSLLLLRDGRSSVTGLQELFGNATLPLHAVTLQQANEKFVGSYATRLDIKDVDPTKIRHTYLMESGREGDFEAVLRESLSTEDQARVIADVFEGLYFISTQNPLYAWRRIYNGPIYSNWFGVKGDGEYITGLVTATTGATDNLTISTAPFNAESVGKKIVIPIAGPAGQVFPSPHLATITGYTSPTTVTISPPPISILIAFNMVEPRSIFMATDDYPRIQLAISSIKKTGGHLIIVGNVATSQTLVLGDAVDGGVSTTYGICLGGLAPPPRASKWSLFKRAAASSLSWVGASRTSPIISGRGPVDGWEFYNLLLDSHALCGSGPFLEGFSFGRMTNVRFKEFLDVSLTISTPSVSTGTDLSSVANTFTGIQIDMPYADGATGIMLDGNTGTVGGDPYYNTFDNVFIGFPGGNISSTGILFKDCDNIRFNNVLMTASGPNPLAKPIVYDYTSGGTQFPNDCIIDHIDYGYNITGTPVFVVGNPMNAANKLWNKINNFSGANGGKIAKVKNLLINGSLVSESITDLAAQTGAIPLDILVTSPPSGFYRISFSLITTVAFAVGSSMSLNIAYSDTRGVQSKSLGNLSIALPGSELQGVYEFEALNTGHIYFNTTGTFNAPLGQYRVRIRVEFIQ